MPEKRTALPEQCIRRDCSMMTVKELIDKLNEIEDKERVYLKVFIDD